jgi:ribosome recycling factor
MGKIEGVSQDNVKSIEVAIDALTSDFVKKVDELVRQKEVDISKV